MRRAGLGEGHYVASGYSVHEEENEHLQEGLRAKVSALKHLTIDIGTEVKCHNKILDDMKSEIKAAKAEGLRIDTDFDSTGGLLGSTIGRVKQLSRGSQTKLLCYMLLFCFFVFFILYWVMKLR